MKQKSILYEIIRGEERPFTDERDKKKFLDLVQKVKQKMGMHIFAFCVTDDESHFLVEGESGRTFALAAAQIIGEFEIYYKNCYQRQCGNIVQEIQFRKMMSSEELVDSCMELHLIPVAQKLVERPEDYWWSSYTDYRRNYRRGIVDADTVLKYLDVDRRRAVRKFVCLHHGSQ